MATRPSASQLAAGTPVEGSALLYQGGGLAWGPGGSGSGVAEVADLAALALVGETGPSTIWVQTLKCLWRREPASTLTVDGVTVIDAIGGGCWERLTATTSLSWLTCTDWYVSAAGNDEAAGGTTSPLATVDEVMRRVSVGPIQQDIVIHLVDTISVTHMRLAVNGGNQARKVTLQGSMTTVTTGTVAAWTAPNHATPKAGVLRANEFSDWTSYLYHRIRFPNNGAYKWASRVDSDGTGDGTRAVQGYVATNAPFAIETFNASVASLEWVAQDTNISLEVLDVSLAETSFRPSVDGAVNITGCRFYNPGAYLSITCIGRAPVTIASCGVYDDNLGLLVRGKVNFEYCSFMYRAQLYVEGSDTYGTYEGLLFDAVVSGLGTQFYRRSEGLFYDTQWFGLGYGVQVFGSSLYLQTVSGTVSDTPLSISGDGARVTWSGTPNITTSGAGDVIDAPFGTGLDWSSSFHSGSQSGVGTLSSGVAVIAVPGGDVRPPMVTKTTGSGAAQGTLAVTAASSTQFTVQALDGTGAVVTDDGSSFAWFIPPYAQDIRFGASVASAPGGMY